MPLDYGDVVSAAIGVLGGAGGVAALLRSRGQNKTDDRRVLLDQEQGFRASLMADVAALRQLVQTLGTDKDKLEHELSEQGKALVRLQVLDEQKTVSIEQLQRQNSALNVRVDEQAREIASLREEKASLQQVAQGAQAAREVLERENNSLRQENSKLREQRDHYWAVVGSHRANEQG